MQSTGVVTCGYYSEWCSPADGEVAHLIPQSALTLNDDGTLGVRLVDAEHIVSFNPITVMRDTAKGIWVTGLPSEADVIVVGHEYVTAGVEVAPTWQELSQ